MKAAVLGHALAQVVGAASKEPAKQHLTAVQLSAGETGLCMAATDSYRMAIKNLPGVDVLTFGQSYLIPSRAARATAIARSQRRHRNPIRRNRHNF